MPNDAQRHLEELFHSACERPSGPERQAYLDGACAGDAKLRLRIDALLKAHDESEGLLEGPAFEGQREGPGSTIDGYKLLQEIGEGGMGIVYMAEQERPVRRKVALKVIKLGMDTKQVIARFEAERQALALMDHGSIARVFDAGTTESGRPYFVMELVRGVPITQYCDTHKMSTGERLELFVRVCRAIQHAHQKGIIHRDLKPSNVLVTNHDGEPVPKIIDFGVAKATNQRLTERTLFTEFQQIIGTPEYMSPEQAEMSGLDVDTRSDIYSLGVLLYKLLTGTTPADPSDLRTAAFSEMTRMIREDEPPVPSTRISKLGDDGVEIARRMGSDPQSLSRTFRGDLDWIVMRALEKDRTRRYGNASDFADDVVRHLEHQPVEAGPPTTAYRLRKFAYRHRSAVLATAVLLVIIGLGLAGTVTGFLRARSEAEHSTRISASLQEVLAMTDPSRVASPGEVEAVLAQVRQLFGEQHATYPAVLDTLSIRLRDAGELETSMELCREAIEAWSSVYGDEHANVAITQGRLGSILLARGEEQQAELELRGALERFSLHQAASGIQGHPTRIALAELLTNRGDYAEADRLLAEALSFLRKDPTRPHYKIRETLEQRVLLQLNQPKGDARETLREVYEEFHRFYPDDSPALGIAALGYGRQLFQHGQPELAEPYLREAVERLGNAATPPTVYLMGACDALFQILRKRQDPAGLADADEVLRHLIAVGRKLWSTDELLVHLRFYANRMLEREDFAEALRSLSEAHALSHAEERPPEVREDLRDRMTRVGFEAAVRPDLDPLTYRLGIVAVEAALMDEPDHPAMISTLGALLYRQGEYAVALETLLLAAPLESVPGGLAASFSPWDHGFRAMAMAQSDNVEAAAVELDRLRGRLAKQARQPSRRNLLREVEALLEQHASRDG